MQPALSAVAQNAASALPLQMPPLGAFAVKDALELHAPSGCESRVRMMEVASKHGVSPPLNLLLSCLLHALLEQLSG